MHVYSSDVCIRSYSYPFLVALKLIRLCGDCYHAQVFAQNVCCCGGCRVEIAWGTATPSSAPIISSLETPDRVSLLANVQWPPLTEGECTVWENSHSRHMAFFARGILHAVWSNKHSIVTGASVYHQMRRR